MKNEPIQYKIKIPFSTSAHFCLNQKSGSTRCYHFSRFLRSVNRNIQ